MRMGDGVEPVGDHQHRPLLHQALQCLPDKRLTLGIKARGWLIKDQQWGVFEKSASDGEALDLARAQASTPLSNLSLVALWELGNKCCRSSEFGDPRDFVAAGAGTGQSNVRSYTPREQVWPLWHQSHRRSPHLSRKVSERDAVRGNPSPLNIHKTQ